LQTSTFAESGLTAASDLVPPQTTSRWSPRCTLTTLKPDEMHTPEGVARSPLAPARQLVDAQQDWQDTFNRLREPLLTHRSISGLQKVHNEWFRESTVQKAMLGMHLDATVKRLELLERNELGHLERIRMLERQLQERGDEIGELQTKLDESERDRTRLRAQLADKRKSNARQIAK